MEYWKSNFEIPDTVWKIESVGKLKRQIAVLLFELLLDEKNNEQDVLKLDKQGRTSYEEKDILKESYLLSSNCC